MAFNDGVFIFFILVVLKLNDTTIYLFVKLIPDLDYEGLVDVRSLKLETLRIFWQNGICLFLLLGPQKYLIMIKKFILVN